MGGFPVVTGRVTIALVAGTLFGAGLALSGMVDPLRVRGFLDIVGGDWDPTLAFVMAGAILPMAFAWRIRRAMARPVADVAFILPTTSGVDRRLLIGSALFGIGWGLAGLCPGPAIADLALSPLPAATFTAAMIGGFASYRIVERAIVRPPRA